MIDNRVEALIKAIGNLRNFHHSGEDVKNIRNCLDRIFKPDATCINFVYTVNTDKLPFGCIVFPRLSGEEINNFLIVGESTRIDEYEVEIDSKLFDYGLTDEQVVQVILFNIYHMIKDIKPCDVVREAIDDYFTKSASQLAIRNSIQYQAILYLGIVDALQQVTSCLYLPNDIVNDAFLESLGLYYFEDTLNRLYQRFPDCDNEATRMPKLSMLEWTLRVYDDVDKERIPAIHLLNKVKSITASTLYIDRINAVINALNRIDTSVAVSEAVNQVFMEAKRRGGLLAYLKYSGLRDIENDLYEFQLRAKNSESEQEVLYALKQINARLAILDDYIRENPDDPDIDRWIGVKEEYMDIRDILAKKKLHKRSYGVFVDYDALDKEDNDQDSTDY